MEIEFNRYKDINCRTKDRVIECIGYQSSLCEFRCNYAKTMFKFNTAKSGLERFLHRYPNYKDSYSYLNKRFQQAQMDELFIGVTG